VSLALAPSSGPGPELQDRNRHRNRDRDPALPARLTVLGVAILVVWPALHYSEFSLAALLEPGNAHTLLGFLSGFWPPAQGPEFLRLLARATLETLAIATAGMAIALVIALPCSLLATRSLSLASLVPGAETSLLGRLLRWPVRGLLIVLRSIPELVWALLFVRAVGLGPTAGVLAIAITYAGMLGKVFAEIYESVDSRPASALLLAGGSRLQVFYYGLLPNALPELLSYSVYRWECAIRASLVLGFVGAGGLGQQMELSIRMFAGGEVASMLAIFLVLVLLMDRLSRLLRSLVD